MSRIRVGCSGWNYADWRERVYPSGLPQRRWLEHYATLFDTVEVNSTFYRLAKPKAVARWVEQTPPDFVFAVKASQYLTHFKRLTDLEQGIERFYEAIAPLAASPKLGPVLWQLPRAVQARRTSGSAAALDGLPPGRHCFEFRHESWFADDEVLDLLRWHGVALAIGDHPGAAVAAVGDDHRLVLRALPLRAPRAARQLQRARAARAGAAGGEAGARRATSSPTSTTTGRGSLSRTPSG